jgi:phage tail sheath protein FI
MPINPSYPGVYVEEIPSGVRTISGVSTSVTAFIGAAKRGPINKAVRILNYGAFERRFGGLHYDAQMTYAVRQFFLNGGTEAWVVRLAKDADQASLILKAADKTTHVLTLTARDAGKAGSVIEVRVDHDALNPASLFNLTLTYNPPDAPGDAQVERFENLTMNSKHARYVVDVLEASKLVEAERVAALGGLGQGTSVSGELADVGTLVDEQHDQFRVSVNGLPPVTVVLVDGVDDADLATLCTAVQTAVWNQAGGEPAMSEPNFTCEADGTTIVMTSGEAGEASTVRVLPGITRDVSARLKLGTLNGGVETDAVAEIRPREIPDPGTLTSDTITDFTLPDATLRTFKISLDNTTPEPIDLGDTAVAGVDLATKLGNMAALIQQKVGEKRPTNAAYKGFTATVHEDNDKLVLASGTKGQGSSVVVTAADANDIAASLHLLGDATIVPGKEETLTGGNEEPYTPADEAVLFNASRTDREGIYALEAVDLFNILCLPGVTNPDVLMEAEAYCRERRAFLIVDAPASSKKPDDMATTIASTALPKSNYAAVYYPWLMIADPLKGGKLEPFPPSGTIAGLYARIDSTRGVWKAPAGTEATLVGVRGVEYLLSDPENGVLNPQGVNCLRVFPIYGAIAWGARTLRGADEMADEYKYVPVRRTALFIEETLYRSLKWVVFEPNDEPLWAQIRLNVGAFLHSLFRQGAFQGTTPREAYFVKCDKETTTQDDINRGIVNILVGFAPLKPAEFVMIKLQQMAGQIAT